MYIVLKVHKTLCKHTNLYQAPTTIPTGARTRLGKAGQDPPPLTAALSSAADSS